MDRPAKLSCFLYSDLLEMILQMNWLYTMLISQQKLLEMMLLVCSLSASCWLFWIHERSTHHLYSLDSKWSWWVSVWLHPRRPQSMLSSYCRRLRLHEDRRRVWPYHCCGSVCQRKTYFCWEGAGILRKQCERCGHRWCPFSNSCYTDFGTFGGLMLCSNLLVINWSYDSYSEGANDGHIDYELKASNLIHLVKYSGNVCCEAFKFFVKVDITWDSV